MTARTLDQRNVSTNYKIVRHNVILFVCVCTGFSLRESMSEVKRVVEGLAHLDGVEGERVELLHKHYQLLVRDYKRLERRVTEGQKKLQEVC